MLSRNMRKKKNWSQTQLEKKLELGLNSVTHTIPNISIARVFWIVFEFSVWVTVMIFLLFTKKKMRKCFSLFLGLCLSFCSCTAQRRAKNSRVGFKQASQRFPEKPTCPLNPGKTEWADGIVDVSLFWKITNAHRLKTHWLWELLSVQL